MKEVIYINRDNVKDEKPVEFTHLLNIRDGWKPTVYNPCQYEEVIYLGKCFSDGDMFAAKDDEGYIHIFKGHLNSGKY